MLHFTLIEKDDPSMSISNLMSFCTLPSSLLGGMALCKTTRRLNEFAATHLGIPIHMFEGKSDAQFAQANISIANTIASMQGISLERHLGTSLYNFITTATREEIAYRFLLEKIVLPTLFPQLENFSMTRTCISTLIFSASHVRNPFPPEVIAGQCINVAFLGMITSLAQEHLGLASSILIHIGFNINGWQHAYNQDSYNILSKLSFVKLNDILKNTSFLFLDGFVSDAILPFTLAYKAYQVYRGNNPPQVTQSSQESTGGWSASVDFD